MQHIVQACRGCGGAVDPLLDFGPQPPSNRFLREGEREIDVHRLALGQCPMCGLVQLVDPMPAPMVRARFPWLVYNEPEGHLDKLAERLTHLDGVGPGSVIAGLTYKDDSTLARLNRLGFPRTFRLDPRADLGLDDPAAGLESVQAAVREDRARTIASQRGLADVLIVRHVLEHAHDPQAFLRGLTVLVKPRGYLVFELPDSSKFMDACDYSFVWEEHIAYFSPATLRAFFAQAGLDIVDTLIYPYALEDSIVMVVRADRGGAVYAREKPNEELARGRRYAKQFPEVRERYRTVLARHNAAGRRVALFGAGHLAAKFLNLFEAGSYIDCVIDDNPNKQVLLMPGSHLPIRNSSILDEGQIDLCLLTLSPESERKVLSAKKAFVDQGGEFRSIFPRSALALQL